MPARPLVELCEREFLRFTIDHVRSHLAGWGFELEPFGAPVKRLWRRDAPAGHNKSMPED
jgi:hypothetical protein